MKLTVGRLHPRTRQPRFLRNIADDGSSLGISPITTSAPDRAREYDDRKIAQVVADLLNVMDSARTGKRSQPWIVVDLPEVWT